MVNKNVEKDFWKDVPVISTYTLEQAIDDGVLVKVGQCGKHQVIFTANLFYDGYEDKQKRMILVQKGIDMLKVPDPQDSDTMRLRVLDKDKIWVIWDSNNVFTFMKCEDY